MKKAVFALARASQILQSRPRQSQLSIILYQLSTSVFLLLALLPMLAQAKYSGGSGTPETPYKIADCNDLYTLAADTNDYNKCFCLTADIDLNPNLPGRRSLTTALIAPDTSTIGTFDGTPFTGTFDGNDCNILNLTIDTHGVSNNHLGLFGKTDADCIITNLGTKDINIIGGHDSRYVGGLVGVNSGGVLDCYATGNVNGHWYVAHLVGYNWQGSITSCYATGDVSGDVRVGGLVGINADGIITNCYATGSITGDDLVGGLVGYNSGDITSCHSTRDVSGNVRVGGLVGVNSGSITSCYAAGLVTGADDYVGALAGSNIQGSITSCYSTGDVSGDYYVGGLVGWNVDSTISNCYATGNVNGTGQEIGGLVGCNYDASITSCYAAGSVSGYDYVGGASWGMNLANPPSSPTAISSTPTMEAGRTTAMVHPLQISK